MSWNHYEEKSGISETMKLKAANRNHKICNEAKEDNFQKLHQLAAERNPTRERLNKFQLQRKK